MAQWEEISDDDNPFGTSGQVDGIVYAAEDYSPELAFAQRTGPALPPPPLPTRPEPQRPQYAAAGPWRPGPEVDPEAFRPKVRRTNPVKVFVLGMIPILVAAAVVYGVIHAYGDSLAR